MTIDDMLGNAATASQNVTLVDCEVTRGALLRSIRDFLLRYPGTTSMLAEELLTQKDYNS